VAEPVTATATTTITNVSVLARRPHPEDRFDLTLSADGIDICRPGRPVQHMAWDRVSEWEVEERKRDVLLTLRGDGAITPLIVPGWSVDDLVGLLRDLTSGSGSDIAVEDLTGETIVDAPTTEEPAAVAAAELAVEPVFVPPVIADEPHQTYEALVPVATPEPPEPAETSAAVRGRHRRRRRAPWKPIVTMVLLGVAATAITLVLLQSAGIINWSFLGPTS
jgi:hypothetical protein